MSIISITGKIGSGKDTVAKMIQYATFCKNHPEEYIHTLQEFLDGNDIYNSDYSYGELTEWKISEDSGWKIKKFAGKLKQISAILLGCNESDFESQEFKDSLLPKEWQSNFKIIRGGTKFTYRWFLQTLGTEALRNNVHNEIWINALFADYNENSNWIISDLRFLNEALAVKQRNGVIIKVIRGESQNNHISETELLSIKCDYVIDNNGTIEELYEKVCNILNLTN